MCPVTVCLGVGVGWGMVVRGISCGMLCELRSGSMGRGYVVLNLFLGFGSVMLL